MASGLLSVLHFSNALARGGAEEHILTLLRGLDRKCFRLHLVCAPEVAHQLRPDLPAHVELLPLTLRHPSHAEAALRLARIIRERKVDILHSHLFYSSLFASPIGRLCGTPLILETPHLREHWRKGWFKSRFVVDRLAGRCVDYYIAVSRANGRYLAESKRIAPEKIVVIQNGCDLDRFDPDRPKPLALKRSLGFDDTDPILLVLGRLEPQKGHRVLLNALPAVRREFPRVRLVCVGQGSLRGALEEQARQLSIHEAVYFAGYQPDVVNWLALADVSVLPSYYEGLPLAAIESLAAGRPLVATAVDGTPEVVIDGKTGITVPPGDPSRLADAVCRMLRQPAIAKDLALAGRQWALERFSQERQIRETEEFYLSAWQMRARAERSGAGTVQTVRTTTAR
jgi:glycosyltransferase involved in cell wall biosynthesis